MEEEDSSPSPEPPDKTEDKSRGTENGTTKTASLGVTMCNNIPIPHLDLSWVESREESPDPREMRKQQQKIQAEKRPSGKCNNVGGQANHQNHSSTFRKTESSTKNSTVSPPVPALRHKQSITESVRSPIDRPLLLPTPPKELLNNRKMPLPPIKPCPNPRRQFVSAADESSTQIGPSSRNLRVCPASNMPAQSSLQGPVRPPGLLPWQRRYLERMRKEAAEAYQADILRMEEYSNIPDIPSPDPPTHLKPPTPEPPTHLKPPTPEPPTPLKPPTPDSNKSYNDFKSINWETTESLSAERPRSTARISVPREDWVYSSTPTSGVLMPFGYPGSNYAYREEAIREIQSPMSPEDSPVSLPSRVPTPFKGSGIYDKEVEEIMGGRSSSGLITAISMIDTARSVKEWTVGESEPSVKKAKRPSRIPVPIKVPPKKPTAPVSKASRIPVPIHKLRSRAKALSPIIQEPNGECEQTPVSEENPSPRLPQKPFTGSKIPQPPVRDNPPIQVTQQANKRSRILLPTRPQKMAVNDNPPTQSAVQAGRTSKIPVPLRQQVATRRNPTEFPQSATKGSRIPVAVPQQVAPIAKSPQQKSAQQLRRPSGIPVPIQQRETRMSRGSTLSIHQQVETPQESTQPKPQRKAQQASKIPIAVLQQPERDTEKAMTPCVQKGNGQSRIPVRIQETTVEETRISPRRRYSRIPVSQNTTVPMSLRLLDTKDMGSSPSPSAEQGVYRSPPPEEEVYYSDDEQSPPLSPRYVNKLPRNQTRKSESYSYSVNQISPQSSPEPETEHPLRETPPLPTLEEMARGSMIPLPKHMLRHSVTCSNIPTVHKPMKIKRSKQEHNLKPNQRYPRLPPVECPNRECPYQQESLSKYDRLPKIHADQRNSDEEDRIVTPSEMPDQNPTDLSPFTTRRQLARTPLPESEPSKAVEQTRKTRVYEWKTAEEVEMDYDRKFSKIFAYVENLKNLYGGYDSDDTVQSINGDEHHTFTDDYNYGYFSEYTYDEGDLDATTSEEIELYLYHTYNEYFILGKQKRHKRRKRRSKRRCVVSARLSDNKQQDEDSKELFEDDTQSKETDVDGANVRRKHPDKNDQTQKLDESEKIEESLDVIDQKTLQAFKHRTHCVFNARQRFSGNNAKPSRDERSTPTIFELEEEPGYSTTLFNKVRQRLRDLYTRKRRGPILSKSKIAKFIEMEEREEALNRCDSAERVNSKTDGERPDVDNATSPDGNHQPTTLSGRSSVLTVFSGVTDIRHVPPPKEILQFLGKDSISLNGDKVDALAKSSDRGLPEEISEPYFQPKGTGSEKDKIQDNKLGEEQVQKLDNPEECGNKIPDYKEDMRDGRTDRRTDRRTNRLEKKTSVRDKRVTLKNNRDANIQRDAKNYVKDRTVMPYEMPHQDPTDLSPFTTGRQLARTPLPGSEPSKMVEQTGDNDSHDETGGYVSDDENQGTTNEDASNGRNQEETVYYVSDTKSQGETNENASNAIDREETVYYVSDTDSQAEINEDAYYFENQEEIVHYVSDTDSQDEDAYYVENQEETVYYVSDTESQGETNKDASNVENQEETVYYVSDAESQDETNEDAYYVENQEETVYYVSDTESQGETNEDASNVENQEETVYYVSVAESQDETNEDASDVENQEETVYYVSDAESQDATNEDASYVENQEETVYYVSDAESQDETNEDAYYVENQEETVYNVSDAESQDKTNEDAYYVENQEETVYYVSDTESRGETNEDASNVENQEETVYYVSDAESQDETNKDASDVENQEETVYYVSDAESQDATNEDASYVENQEETVYYVSDAESQDETNEDAYYFENREEIIYCVSDAESQGETNEDASHDSDETLNKGYESENSHSNPDQIEETEEEGWYQSLISENEPKKERANSSTQQTENGQVSDSDSQDSNYSLIGDWCNNFWIRQRAAEAEAQALNPDQNKETCDENGNLELLSTNKSNEVNETCEKSKNFELNSDFRSDQGCDNCEDYKLTSDGESDQGCDNCEDYKLTSDGESDQGCDNCEDYKLTSDGESDQGCDNCDDYKLTSDGESDQGCDNCEDYKLTSDRESDQGWDNCDDYKLTSDRVLDPDWDDYQNYKLMSDGESDQGCDSCENYKLTSDRASYPDWDDYQNYKLMSDGESDQGCDNCENYGESDAQQREEATVYVFNSQRPDSNPDYNGNTADTFKDLL